LPYGIRVGAVSPGPVDTPLVSDGPEEFFEWIEIKKNYVVFMTYLCH